MEVDNSWFGTGLLSWANGFLKYFGCLYIINCHNIYLTNKTRLDALVFDLSLDDFESRIETYFAILFFYYGKIMYLF